ncbi:ATP-dependent DNA helicase II subunit 1 [Ancistrocladus abbreviatus]
MKQIGSQYGIVPGSRENSLYNALWVALVLLRKGSVKTADKRMLLFTNEDDPFGSIKGVTKLDMMRTTMQRAKDAQDLGISIEILPLSSPAGEFNMSLFYADMIGLEGDALAEFIPSATERLEDMKYQLRKRMFKKRRYRRITFSIAGGLSIQLSAYALVRPTVTGTITWLDSVTNLPLKASASYHLKLADLDQAHVKTERSFICGDTGALVQEPPMRFQSYRNEDVKISLNEISEIKRVSTGQLHLLGFKPLSCLKDYHNLRPSTFLYPSDEEVIGSSRIFYCSAQIHVTSKPIGLYIYWFIPFLVDCNSHCVRFGWFSHLLGFMVICFALAFFGGSSHPQLVALIAQDEIIISGSQIEPPGMHMIFLPYSDDIRHIEEARGPSSSHDTDLTTLRASEDHIKKATNVVKRIELKDFSVCQFSNPALQKHYAVLQALALEEDEMPEIKDETLPDEEGMARPGIVNALEDFKLSVYGENYGKEDDHVHEASKKRKAGSDAVKECANYDWHDLADSGRLKDLTIAELKYYLIAHNLPVTGKKGGFN